VVGPEESGPTPGGAFGGGPSPDSAPDTPESLLDGSLDPAPAEQSAPGRPVVSDGTAGEGDSAEPVRAGSGVEQAYADEHPDTILAAERLVDLQRLQAEYVNYKRRVDRDRDLARDAGTAAVLEALLPVLDDIHLAREHGDLTDGPFAAIADKLAAVLTRFGVTEIGAAGQEFDPTVHEALRHVQAELPEGATATTVVQVLQPGYMIGERVIRPARVSVADPQ
jgi:molecular chaperone GrpE